MLHPVMRTAPQFMLVVAALLLVPGRADAAGTAANKNAARHGGDVVAGSRLKIQVEKSKVNLAEHHLEVKMWPHSGKVSLVVLGESGATLADEEQDFTGRPAGAPLVVSWTPSSDEAVARIDVRASDENGYIGVALLPWSIAIPHDDVVFRTDSSEIDQTELPKLEVAFTRLGELVAKDKDKEHRSITLFIAGHTDTVGGDAYNLKLSRERARAIATWFRHRGARIGIAYEGFGETAPAVRTADNVDEPRNRRVDYILADDEPTMKTTGFKPSWKRIN